MSATATFAPDLDHTGPVPGKWFHELEEPGRLQCDLCPRYCKIRPGQRGMCYVRKNDGASRVVIWKYDSSGSSLRSTCRSQ